MNSIEPIVRTSNILLSIEFYSEVLDFTVELAPHPDPNRFESKYALLERHGFAIHLSAHEGDGVFGSKFYVRVPDVDSLYSKFVAQGLNTTRPESPPALRGGPIDQTWQMREFWVHDPDQNTVVFGHRLS